LLANNPLSKLQVMIAQPDLRAAPDIQRVRSRVLVRWRTYTLYGLLLLVMASVAAFAILQPFQVLPRIGLSPGFALMDQDGERLTSEDLRGRIVLYNFTYSGCVSPCPQTSRALRALQARIPQIETYGLPIEFVTISFDAIHDRPAQLRTYAAELGADPTNWRFLTGDTARLKEVIGGGFGVYYAAQEDGTFVHDPTFVLVDWAGIVRAHYRTAAPDLARLARDIELLSREARDSQGAMRLAYEAAHQFLCYPK
jgi:protein SCO1/2